MAATFGMGSKCIRFSMKKQKFTNFSKNRRFFFFFFFFFFAAEIRKKKNKFLDGAVCTFARPLGELIGLMLMSKTHDRTLSPTYRTINGRLSERKKLFLWELSNSPKISTQYRTRKIKNSQKKRFFFFFFFFFSKKKYFIGR